MASSDLLSRIYDELDARLRELRPILDEYESLLSAAAALEPAVDTSTGAGTSSRAVSKPASRRRSAIAPKRAPRDAVVAAPKRAPRDAAVAAPKRAPRSALAAAPKQAPRGAAPKRARRGAVAAPNPAPRSAVAGAILAALEHGSHTVSELAVVTAMSTQIINNDLRPLQQAGTIARTKREGDGKAAYALTASTPV
jgi:hypothetical protein